MNWRNNDVALLLAAIVLFAVAYAMKVPSFSAGDLVLTTVVGLIAIDIRSRL
jgi:hypothetical protein